MKRTLIALTAGIAVTGGVFASAASLGGVALRQPRLQRHRRRLMRHRRCVLDYSTAYDSASGTYVVNGVTVDEVTDACKGETIEVSLKNNDGKATTTTARTDVTGTSQDIEVEGFAGESVDSAAVLIQS